MGFNYHKLHAGTFLINCLALRAHYSFYQLKKKLDTGGDTGWQGKEGWVGLAEYQEGREKGGAHCLDMDKSVRRAT